MNSEVRHIGWWLGSMLMLLLAVGCSSGSEDAESPQPKEKAVLKLYVFPPDKPIVTRDDEGDVIATDDENRIRTLDVWVFETGTSNLVSYAHLNSPEFDSYNQRVVTMDISDAFADNPSKPNVDIFVAANAAAYSDKALHRETSVTDLQGALIKYVSASVDHFGMSGLENLANSVMAVPADGLPMSGFLKNQPITGSAPVFEAKTQNVKLVRAVSKIRFIFSKSTQGAPEVSNLSVSLNTNMLPNEEYLFLDGTSVAKSHINTAEAYNTAATFFSGKSIEDIGDCSDPVSYGFRSTTATAAETGQEYETRINEALAHTDDVTGAADPYVTELGRFYLRESDKQLKGKITYTLGSGATAVNKSADFSMAQAGDFTRNHTWIVYGYFLGSGDLILNVVCVKAWTDSNDAERIHNW